MEQTEFWRQAPPPQLYSRQQRQTDSRSDCDPRGIDARLRNRRFYVYEVDPVGLGGLLQGSLYDTQGNQRPDLRHQHGGVLEMVCEASELSRHQCKNSCDLARGVQSQL